MKKGILFIVFLIYSFAGISVSFADTKQSSKSTQTTIIMKQGAPKGVIIKKNKITLQKGYTFNKVSENKATVVYAKKRKDGSTGPISGEFTCGCITSSGSCRLVIDGTSIWCSTNTCGSTCQMTVSIPSAMNVIQ